MSLPTSIRVGAPAAALDARTERVDSILTHPVAGTLVFLGVMGALFWTLFALATVPMDLIELTFASLGAGVSAVMPEGPLRDLLIDGVIGGIAGTVVFLPQICLLFFMISLLEDTGVPRARRVCERPHLPPVRTSWSRVCAAPDRPRMRAAGDHEHAPDSGSP